MKTTRLLLTLFSCLCASGPVAAETPAPTILVHEAVTVSLKGIPDGQAEGRPKTYAVSDAGMLQLPKLERSVQAQGLTPAQLAKAIEAAYRDAGIYAQPTAVVALPDRDRIPEGQPTVTVGGQVRRPGPKKFVEGMTVEQAIEAADKLTEFGSPHRVQLIRDGKARALDLTKDKDKKLTLKANDTLEILQRSISCG